MIKLTKTIPAVLVAAFLLSGCETAPAPVCELGSPRSLDRAMTSARHSLLNGCSASFSRYFDDLLLVAEGDPQPEHRRAFSDYLEWSAAQGLVSRRQAQEMYNRYFNVKFVSLAGDYNNCSLTCRQRPDVMADMATELVDKERGLVRISQDNDTYYRADLLMRETELVLEATCRACEAGRQ
jgi:hypothetical protein